MTPLGRGNRRQQRPSCRNGVEHFSQKFDLPAPGNEAAHEEMLDRAPSGYCRRSGDVLGESLIGGVSENLGVGGAEGPVRVQLDDGVEESPYLIVSVVVGVDTYGREVEDFESRILRKELNDLLNVARTEGLGEFMDKVSCGRHRGAPCSQDGMLTAG